MFEFGIDRISFSEPNACDRARVTCGEHSHCAGVSCWGLAATKMKQVMQMVDIGFKFAFNLPPRQTSTGYLISRSMSLRLAMAVAWGAWLR
jgi:hypothetical protein